MAEINDSNQQKVQTEEEKLKYLEFVQVAALHTVLYALKAYSYAKENSGPLKNGVQTVEGTVKTVVAPVYDKYHDVPSELLKLVDRKVDESVHKLDSRVPPAVKQLSSRALFEGYYLHLCFMYKFEGYYMHNLVLLWVVNLDVIHDIIDQAYTINATEVVFIRKRPQNRQFKGSGNYCTCCDRSLQEPFYHCSLGCKVEFVLKHYRDLSPFLRKCKTLKLGPDFFIPQDMGDDINIDQEMTNESRHSTIVDSDEQPMSYNYNFDKLLTFTWMVKDVTTTFQN